MRIGDHQLNSIDPAFGISIEHDRLEHFESRPTSAASQAIDIRVAGGMRTPHRTHSVPVQPAPAVAIRAVHWQTVQVRGETLPRRMEHETSNLTGITA